MFYVLLLYRSSDTLANLNSKSKKNRYGFAREFSIAEDRKIFILRKIAGSI